MTELTKIETSRASRSLSERTAVAAIVALLIAVQMVYVAKHAATFAGIIVSSPLGIIAP